MNVFTIINLCLLIGTSLLVKKANQKKQFGWYIVVFVGGFVTFAYGLFSINIAGDSAETIYGKLQLVVTEFGGLYFVFLASVRIVQLVRSRCNDYIKKQNISANTGKPLHVNRYVKLEQVGPLIAGLLFIIWGLYSLLFNYEDNIPTIYAIFFVILGTACVLRCTLAEDQFKRLVSVFKQMISIVGSAIFFLIGICLLGIFVVIIYLTLPSVLALPTNTLIVIVFLYFIFTRK